MRKILVMMSTLVLIWWLSPGDLYAATTYDKTIMIYMNGSDLESEYYAASADLLEILAPALPDNVALVILTGGTLDWHTDEYGLPSIPTQTLQSWQVVNHQLKAVKTYPLASMGEAATLSDFVVDVVKTFPAKTNELILWNHGAGSVYGYGADELFDYDSLLLSELQVALNSIYKQLGRKLDLVGFDACLMASYEVAHSLAPYVRYLVASEELEPGHGWDYEAFLKFVSNKPLASPLEDGKAIMAGFAAQSSDYGTREAMTVSLLNLDKTAGLKTSLESLFAKMLELMKDESQLNKLLLARLKAESYGESNPASNIPDSDMVDIAHLISLLPDDYQREAAGVQSVLDSLVITAYQASYKPNANGISIYYPARDKDTMAYAPDVFSKLGLGPNHRLFLSEISNLLLTSQKDLSLEQETQTLLPDGFDQIGEGAIGGNDDYYHISISQTQMAEVAEIYTLFGRMDYEDDIQYLGRDLIDQGAVLDNNTVIGTTIHSWIKLNGYLAPLYYESQDSSGVMTYYIPIILNGVDADLIVLFSEAYPNGTILGARRLDGDHENIYNRSLLAIYPDDVITLIYEYDIYDAYDDYYYYDGWYEVYTFSPSNGLKLSWEALTDGYYTYCFEIVDLYGNRYFTDWISYHQEAMSGYNTIDPTIWANLLQESGSTAGLLYPWTDQASQPSTWAQPYVETAYNNGLTVPEALKDFRDNIDRELFCELVVKMVEASLGSELTITDQAVFLDTSSEAIQKAYSAGIVTGYGNGLFGPEDPITREQLMVMFDRALEMIASTKLSVTIPETDFADQGLISDWAIDSVALMVYYDLVSGVGNNLLAPKDPATIEQAIKLVNGVYEFVQ